MLIKDWTQELQIATPCPASWEQMQGDDRARLCAQCNRHVYSFLAMTRDEAQTFLRERTGQQTCVRLYRRRDGTVITSDCAVGLAIRAALLSTRALVWVAGVFGFGLITAAVLSAFGDNIRQQFGASAGSIGGGDTSQAAPPPRVLRMQGFVTNNQAY